jgi:hypothetical protein
MKIALLVVGVLVGLIAVIALIGLTLPRDHVASRTVRLRRAQADVFAACTANATDPKQREELKLEILESQSPSKLVTKIGPGLPFGGTWTYEISTQGDETVLTVTERGEVYNPIFRFVSRFVMGHTATLDKFMASLQA